jgi:hypothetical protein
LPSQPTGVDKYAPVRPVMQLNAQSIATHQ